MDMNKSARQPQRYSQQYLALSIPGSRQNARNASSTHPYCNRQPLKSNFQIDWNHKKLTSWKFFTQIVFISCSMV